jgi:hypothetical protein
MLSNPFGFQVEWFDSLKNSLGFTPPPPSPPHHTPPHTSPPFHPPAPPPVTSTSHFLIAPSSNYPTSSFDSPLYPPLPCFHCVEREALEESLDDLKHGLGDIKTAINEMQNREMEHWRHMDLLMNFLQDLRQAI